MWNMISTFLEPLELYPLYMKEVSNSEVIIYTHSGKRIKVSIEKNQIVNIQFL